MAPGKGLDALLRLGSSALVNRMTQQVRRRISSGAPWEARVGYSRAVRVGPLVVVAGTTATRPDGSITGEGDPHAQTLAALEIALAALAELGGAATDVVRTRLFVTRIDAWEEVGRAHAHFFADVRPAATMVEVSRLIDPRHLVEVELDAWIVESPG